MFKYVMPCLFSSLEKHFFELILTKQQSAHHIHIRFYIIYTEYVHSSHIKKEEKKMEKTMFRTEKPVKYF